MPVTARAQCIFMADFAYGVDAERPHFPSPVLGRDDGEGHVGWPSSRPSLHPGSQPYFKGRLASFVSRLPSPETPSTQLSFTIVSRAARQQPGTQPRANSRLSIQRAHTPPSTSRIPLDRCHPSQACPSAPFVSVLPRYCQPRAELTVITLFAATDRLPRHSGQHRWLRGDGPLGVLRCVVLLLNCDSRV